MEVDVVSCDDVEEEVGMMQHYVVKCEQIQKINLNQREVRRLKGATYQILFNLQKIKYCS